ncbi:hypothetical protein [Sinosporangium siamense]|uniref:MerR family transcriptional regulator n=1 Tax=Sinosporangium siamense TaxID=1367973 RepID=A0A919V9N5_9ACTN|nr:hypothetical protein [Sinosporangium siamense]GII95506.1 hypothetical protein Ssi02_57370 [Sinosporangium siamense]
MERGTECHTRRRPSSSGRPPPSSASRVKELLVSPGRLAEAISEIDRDLREQAEEIVRTRERIARLGAGDRLYVSAEVADYLDRLRELGVSRRTIQMERDIWILLHSLSPDEAAIWLADKCDAMNDPEFRALYLEHDAAFDWSADDPRLPALADRTRRWLTERHNAQGEPWALRDPVLARLAASSVDGSSPAWERLIELAAEPQPEG